jgi:hypothetical protein
MSNRLTTGHWSFDWDRNLPVRSDPRLADYTDQPFTREEFRRRISATHKGVRIRYDQSMGSPN